MKAILQAPGGYRHAAATCGVSPQTVRMWADCGWPRRWYLEELLASARWREELAEAVGVLERPAAERIVSIECFCTSCAPPGSRGLDGGPCRPLSATRWYGSAIQAIAAARPIKSTLSPGCTIVQSSGTETTGSNRSARKAEIGAGQRRRTVPTAWLIRRGRLAPGDRAKRAALREVPDESPR